MGSYLDLVVIGIFFVAYLFDSKEGRIPNELVSLELILGGLFRFIESGVWGLLVGTVEVLACAASMYLLYKIRCIGAGDVKLISAASMIIGTRQVVNIVLLSFILCAGFAVFLFLKSGNLLERLFSVWNYLEMCVVRRELFAYDCSAPRVHFGVFLLGGAVVEKVFGIIGGFRLLW